MIFVSGASRSGTTLLSNMLRVHPEIAGLKEMHYFGEFWDPHDGPRVMEPGQRRDAVATLFERQKTGIHVISDRRSRLSDPDIDDTLDALPPRADAAEVFAATVAHLASRLGKTIPCEQTPRNIYYAAELLERYPNARFVHMLRDPRGVMASQKHRWRRRSLMRPSSRVSHLQQLRTWVNYHPYTVTQLWNLATRLALECQNHPRFFLLRFEDLIEDPDARIRALCAFLGVEFAPSMLDVERVNSSYVSVQGAARGLSRDPVDAWRTKLSRDERGIVSERCAPLMREVGYPVEPTAVSRSGRLKMTSSYAVHALGVLLVNPKRLGIQAKALLGRRRNRASAPSADSRQTVFGLPCVDTRCETAAQDLVVCALAGVKRRVAFVNAHTVNVSVRDPSLQQALRSADIIFADGIGMAMAARLQGARLRHNVNGTDLFPHLCAEAAEAGVRVALLGAAPGVVEDCAKVLGERYPALQVVWRHHGYFEPAQTADIISQINRSEAQILLVAMGVPKQELWIESHFAALKVPVAVGVGALFDFVAGRVPRAPRLVQSLRMEWLFRLLVEPRRLFGRYVLGNPLFLARALKYAVSPEASAERRVRAP